MKTPAQTISARAPFKKLVNHDKLGDIPAADKARAQSLLSRAFISTKNAAVNTVVSYVAEISVGTPATPRLLIVDTGSSNTWVGASTPFSSTGTTKQLNVSMGVNYGSGFVRGTQVVDAVSFGSPLIIANQSIGVAQQFSGFSGVDGIVGIGPARLTSGTVHGPSQGLVPTVTDNLFSSGVIPAPIVGISFQATNDTFDVNGELVFGGVDSSKFTGELSVFSMSDVPAPANQFFGINAQFTPQGGDPLLNSVGIIDTGTTLIMLSKEAFASYAAQTGAKLDNATGLLSVTEAQFTQMKTLNLVVNGQVTLPITRDAQRWPQALTTAIGGDPKAVYLIIGNLGTSRGSGIDFILGQFFLERFYSVFDSSGFVGLAQTAFTNAVVNGV
ncbi:family A1 protease [Exidia glandulosa HHB12029]|uniref:Family A1 protease n=1 Tax=Exidia glandulosa HHB12029 TaxID=1314781 RepID=A0A165F0Y7_EXIGL|nr:family A1 protease [Exidia glandulosa HHB12029]